MTTAHPRVAVVGAGVLGLATARELALAGADVTVLDRTGPGAGTSSTTYAWVNANGKTPDDYLALNLAGLRAHAALQRDSPAGAPWFVRSGTVEWAADGSARAALEARVARISALGYAAERVPPGGVPDLLPGVRAVPDGTPVWHFPEEGYLHPHRLLARLWSEAREHGAELRAPAEVVGVDEAAGAVTLRLADGGTWRGDRVVLATGRWSAHVVGLLGRRLAMVDADRADPVACGFLAVTSAYRGPAPANLITPGLNLHPTDDGRLLLQGLDLDVHADPARPADPAGPVGTELLRRARALLVDADDLTLDRLDVGQRSRPADGLPAIGALTPRVHLAVTHSGMTLAPVVGRLVADELLTGDRPAALAPYAPGRLLDRDPADLAPVPDRGVPAAQ